MPTLHDADQSEHYGTGRNPALLAHQQENMSPTDDHLASGPGRQRDETRRFVKQYSTEVAAGTSSVLSTIATFPLDSVKTRMQTYQYKGAMDCIRHTYQTEHLRGFFRGVLAPLASVTIVRTVSFSVYSNSMMWYARLIKGYSGYDVLAHAAKQGTYPTFYSAACFGAAGATAGCFITFVACPFELTKLSAQVSVLLADKERQGTEEISPERRRIAESYQGKGTLRTMQNIVKHRGFMGLYTGLKLHLMRDTLGTAIYFSVYESSKQLSQALGGDHPITNKLSIMWSGALCGIVSWVMIYPIDCAKSNYQRTSLTYSRGQKVDAAPKIEWFKRHMYRGLGVSMLRSCLLNVIFLSTFEILKKRINSLDDTTESDVD